MRRIFQSTYLFPFLVCCIIQEYGLYGFLHKWNLPYDHQKYLYFPEQLRIKMIEETKKMFYFGYDNYMKYAFPHDELNPILCRGRGPDYANPSNININDVLGNYSLTLIDTLDSLAVFGNVSEFKRAVDLVIQHVSFNQNSVVQVFEANIRVLGGLLSAHLLLVDQQKLLGDFHLDNYENELLEMAHDLATRLLPAFENTRMGIPHPRVHLKNGVPINGLTETCTAGAGSLLLEFGILSRLINDPIFENYARRAMKSLWDNRNKDTGLLGNTIDVLTGKWTSRMTGIGAGMDSYFEYLLKAYILFSEVEDLETFKISYEALKTYLRRGRVKCNKGEGDHPVYVNVDMNNGVTLTTWIDALQAAFPGIQVLYGDIEEAICSHAIYYSMWEKWGFIPERFNWQLKEPDVAFYPLRPEFVESTYLLYQLFEVDHPINKMAERFLFSTEGHVIPITADLRSVKWEEDETLWWKVPSPAVGSDPQNLPPLPPLDVIPMNESSAVCHALPLERTYSLPLEHRYLVQLFDTVGADI